MSNYDNSDRTILNLDDQRRVALLNGDTNTIQTLFANELMYVHSSAIVDTKTSYLTALCTGAVVYQSIELRDRQVQIVDGLAILTGIAQMRVVVNAVPQSVHIRYTTTWIKRAQTWQMLVFASTPLPSSQPEPRHSSHTPSIELS